MASPDKTGEILDLAQALIRIPSVTASLNERLGEVRRAAGFIHEYLCAAGLETRLFADSRYPAILAGFTERLAAPVTLCGHFDVVEPEPDDRQFEPRLEGEYLWGRGAADMKTVVATFMVWMKDVKARGGAMPPINLLLVGNEENGESEPAGTPHVLRFLEAENGRDGLPDLLVAGERTGERGVETWGEICTENRGVMRLEVRARGRRGHSAAAPLGADLAERMDQVRRDLQGLLSRSLTLQSQDGWRSQIAFPYLQVGTEGIFNITPDNAVIGVEVRPIPGDDLGALEETLQAYCREQGLELAMRVKQNGVACRRDNTCLLKLVEAVRQVSGLEPRLGRKLPATSARFAPGGQGVVWGQTGIGPHAAGERHFIPSIEPYFRALNAYGLALAARSQAGGCT